MKKTQFKLERDRDVKIQVYQWTPDDLKQAKGVLQIAHGMAEHAQRYENFAEFLTAQGYIVYANDHRGHGHSLVAPDDLGYFADENGFDKVVGDMLKLSQHIKHEHSGLPLLLFGHSMGSFLARRYVQFDQSYIDGLILSGTGGDQGVMGKIGRSVAKIEKRRIGKRTPSPLMNKLIFGDYNKKFQPNRTDFDFLSRDDAEVDKYVADDLCGFICTSGFYLDLISGIETISKQENLGYIVTDLPIFFIAGDQDPVGNQGKGVKEVYETYLRHGGQNISLKLYPGARHEILNEINKEEVYEDILNWMDATIED